MSTGGCPQVVSKKVELLKDVYNIIVIEWECVAWNYIVQRNNVINMIGGQFITLNENKEQELFEIIDNHNSPHIMIEEFSETFMSTEIMERLYDKNRSYKIFETTHSSHSKPDWKKFLPDKFIFVSPYSLKVFEELGVPMDLIEYPIEIKQPNKIDNISVGSGYSVAVGRLGWHSVSLFLASRSWTNNQSLRAPRHTIDTKKLRGVWKKRRTNRRIKTVPQGLFA